jgi:hypothetical protein
MFADYHRCGDEPVTQAFFGTEDKYSPRVIANASAKSLDRCVDCFTHGARLNRQIDRVKLSRQLKQLMMVACAHLSDHECGLQSFHRGKFTIKAVAPRIQHIMRFKIDGLSLGVQISPLGIDRLKQGDFRPARHLLDLARAANSLVDILEFFAVDQPVDVIASRE